jgi:hypothetical protein
MNLKILELKEATPRAWLTYWSNKYSATSYDERTYERLVSKRTLLTRTDFIAMGKWKDGATEGKRWNRHVASVAYDGWMAIARNRPICPPKSEVEEFLEKWSSIRGYISEDGIHLKRFGLSRASTLLHFISRGKYPIYDSRVRRAIARISNSTMPQNTVEVYCNIFCPFFASLANDCRTLYNLRKLDKALFSYGAKKYELPSREN